MNVTEFATVYEILCATVMVVVVTTVPLAVVVGANVLVIVAVVGANVLVIVVEETTVVRPDGF